METGGPVYQERFGWTWQIALLVLGCAAFVAVLILILLFRVEGQPFNAMLAIVGIVFFGGGGVLFLVMVLFRRLALRADQAGITFGGLPLGIRSRAFAEWPNVVAVVVFGPVGPALTSSPPCIGVKLRGDAPLMAGSYGPRLRRLSADLAPGVPGDVVGNSRAILGWHLDLARLQAVTSAYAPHVRVVDLRGLQHDPSSSW